MRRKAEREKKTEIEFLLFLQARLQARSRDGGFVERGEIRRAVPGGPSSRPGRILLLRDWVAKVRGGVVQGDAARERNRLPPHGGGHAGAVRIWADAAEGVAAAAAAAADTAAAEAAAVTAAAAVAATTAAAAKPVGDVLLGLPVFVFVILFLFFILLLIFVFLQHQEGQEEVLLHLLFKQQQQQYTP